MSPAPSSLQVFAGEPKRRDAELLAELGYEQEFKREFSLISCMAFAFSIMGVIASVSSTFEFGLSGGGHVGIIWGWLLPGFFVLPVAAVLAELASSMPTSGGLYFWSSELAPKKFGPFAAWLTAWSNVTGQVALVCLIDYTCAQMICVALAVGTGFEASLGEQYGIFVALLVVHAILCSSATKILARLNILYVLINLAVTFAVIICFAVVPDEHVSASVAFGKFENFSTWNGGMSFLLAFTAPMWSLTGYDAAAHIAEECTNATTAAPLAILVGVSSTWLLGFFVLISASFAIVDVGSLVDSDLAMPMAQLLYNILGKKGMLVVWCLIIVVQFNTAAAQMVDASRVVFAISRDGALPGSRFMKQINRWTTTPVYAVLFVAVGSGLLGLLALNEQAGLALFSVAVIGIYVSYAIPILLRCLPAGQRAMESRKGPFSLGSSAVPLGIVATAWVIFIVIVLLFPSNPNPAAPDMNYAVVILAFILGGAILAWVVSARHWFTGPVRTISAAVPVEVEEKSPRVDAKEKELGRGASAEVVAVVE
ncbi:amino acid/polyamine transporter I [Leucosporidium creatinivorum]|uniref:Amino acid/polyamine transporter I n=1 Tax=Leucosporidium creatinivorum TaxID=106004 RepID=A0A1Y2EUR2_9BASI|nr:amino acid/polyamine transporter I [Leucosporidium creatinivorum]